MCAVWLIRLTLIVSRSFTCLLAFICRLVEIYWKRTINDIRQLSWSEWRTGKKKLNINTPGKNPCGCLQSTSSVRWWNSTEWKSCTYDVDRRHELSMIKETTANIGNNINISSNNNNNNGNHCERNQTRDMAEIWRRTVMRQQATNALDRLSTKKTFITLTRVCGDNGNR